MPVPDFQTLILPVLKLYADGCEPNEHHPSKRIDAGCSAEDAAS
jgi:hypothetical protein